MASVIMLSDVGRPASSNHPISDELRHRIVRRSPPGGVQRSQQSFGKAGLFFRAQEAPNGHAPAPGGEVKPFHAIFVVSLLIETNPERVEDPLNDMAAMA